MLRREGPDRVRTWSAPVDDLPLAVLATVDLGDAQDVRLDRDAVDRHRGGVEADRVGPVPTDACGDNVDALVGAVGTIATPATRALPACACWQ
jgi:hypothetical protein